jgi:hypothetical protein
MHPSQKPRSADATHQRCSLVRSLSTTPITRGVLDLQQKGNLMYVLLFVDLDKPCLWYHPRPMKTASQIRIEIRMVRKSIGKMTAENVGSGLRRWRYLLSECYTLVKIEFRKVQQKG